ncbi:MAG: hypothetical protein IT384_29380 [Deltaproteobacteria bacterium]|nr:hypothetical protein [Deltaproteobacteria bacterium]
MRSRRLAVAVLGSMICIACQEPPAAGDAGSAARAGASANPATTTSTAPVDLAKAAGEAREKLERWVKDGAADPQNGWAMAHGLIGFGPDLAARDGRKAVDVIVSDFAQVETTGGGKRVHFPRRSKAGVVLESHQNLMIAKMLEAQVPLDRKVEVKGLGAVTLGRLVDDAYAQLTIPATDAAWQDFAWTLRAMLMAYSADAPATGAKASARQKRLVEASLSALAHLEQEQSFIGVLMDAGQPERLEKRKQGIYAHTCGGLHFIEAGLRAAAFLGTPEAKARAKRQIDVLVFRWRAEREIYRRSIAQAPQYKLILLVQELKFYGHTLEALALARELGLTDRSPDEILRAGRVAADLIRVITVLSDAYAKLDQVRAEREQTYLDLIGDGCHAIHGLRESVVAFFRP